MRELKLNTKKVFKAALICYAIVFLAGIVCAFVFKINLDINFRGGYKVAYQYTGTLTEEDIKETVTDAIGKEPIVTLSDSYADSNKIFEVSYVGKDTISDDERETLKTALEEKYQGIIVDPDAKDSSADGSQESTIENTDATSAGGTTESSVQETTEQNAAEAKEDDAAVSSEASSTETSTDAAAETPATDASAEKTTDTNTVTTTGEGADASAETATDTDATTTTEQEEEKLHPVYSEASVNPTIAGSFFIKSLFAVLLTAFLVIIYVGIRFKKIGGISAAVTALCALILDLLVTFCACILFRLQIDSNYIAVILTILGYSLNDTIVVYDRVRENRRLTPDMEIGELVDKSINAVKTRNFVTTLTTFLAVMTIVVVSELYGLTTLRTFAIPMAFGLISGCISSLFIAGPLWVKWRVFSAARKEAKAARPKKAKKA